MHKDGTDASGSGPLFFLGEFLGSLLPVVLGLFGVFALFAYLLNTSARQWATVAFLFSIVGLGLTLPARGASTMRSRLLAEPTWKVNLTRFAL